MGRMPKKGLDFYRKDVDTWDDFKIMDLVDRYGPLGFCIYDVVVCSVYKSGYYLEVPLDDLARLVARKIGNRWIKGQNLVLQVIQYCADIGLFDDALLSQSVITSVGIQQRYSEVTARNKVDKSKYWLLEKNECQAAFESVPIRDISVTEKPISVTEKPISATSIRQSKRNKNKLNKSKVCTAIPCINGSYDVTEGFIAELTHTYPDMDIGKALNKIYNYLTANPHKQGYVGSAEGYIRMWIADDDRAGKHRKKQEQAASYDIAEYEKTSVLDYDI